VTEIENPFKSALKEMAAWETRADSLQRQSQSINICMYFLKSVNS